MIKLVKRRFMIFTLFCLLIVIAIMPIVLLGVSNDRLMDKPTIVTLPWEPTMDKEEIGQDSYDALTRLLSIHKLNEEKSSYIVEWSAAVMSVEQQQQLISTAEEQLNILQSLKVLPRLDFSDRYGVKIAKKTYMDMKNPNNPINIWRITTQYSGSSVTLYMDMDTSFIYEVFVISKTNGFYYDVSKNSKEYDLSEDGKAYALYDLSADYFLEYLQSDSGSNEREGEVFRARGYYTQTTAKVFVTSSNKDTQVVTNYEFEATSDYIAVDKNIKEVEKGKNPSK